MFILKSSIGRLGKTNKTVAEKSIYDLRLPHNDIGGHAIENAKTLKQMLLSSA